MPATKIEKFTASSLNTSNDDMQYCDVQHLDRAISELALQAHIDSASLTRFSQVKSSLLDWLSSASIQSPLIHPNSWAQWGWYPFVDNPEMRIGLLEIHHNKPIPIHDHPNANGLLLVLNGTLRIDEFYCHPIVGSHQMKMAELALKEHIELHVNDYSLILPDDGNIHSLTSKSDVCVVLDILLTPYDEAQRTWYMPVTKVNEMGQHFNTFCLQRRS